MEKGTHGWKMECRTVAGATHACDPLGVMFGCLGCRAAYCGPCASHLRQACPRCIHALDEITVPSR